MKFVFIRHQGKCFSGSMSVFFALAAGVLVCGFPLASGAEKHRWQSNRVGLEKRGVQHNQTVRLSSQKTDASRQGAHKNSLWANYQRPKSPLSQTDCDHCDQKGGSCVACKRAANSKALWSNYQGKDPQIRQTVWDGYSRKQSSCEACQRAPSNNLVYNALDSLAGGIESLLSLSPRQSSNCDSIGCDACDRSMLNELGESEVIAVPNPRWDKPADQKRKEAPVHPLESQPRSMPYAPRRQPPAPILPDTQVDPFQDEQTFIPGRNEDILPSAYFE